MDVHKNSIEIAIAQRGRNGEVCAFRGSRPSVPDDSGHRFRMKAAGYRSEATLVFDKSQILVFKSNGFSFFAWILLSN
jgi:hypothetical protein